MTASKMQAALLAGLPLILSLPAAAQANNDTIGKEVSAAVHLKDGDEVQMPIPDLLAFGSQLFQARWTTQEGQGRPSLKARAIPVRPLVSAFLSTELSTVYLVRIPIPA